MVVHVFLWESKTVLYKGCHSLKQFLTFNLRCDLGTGFVDPYCVDWGFFWCVWVQLHSGDEIIPDLHQEEVFSFFPLGPSNFLDAIFWICNIRIPCTVGVWGRCFVWYYGASRKTWYTPAERFVFVLSPLLRSWSTFITSCRRIILPLLVVQRLCLGDSTVSCRFFTIVHQEWPYGAWWCGPPTYNLIVVSRGWVMFSPMFLGQYSSK